MKLLKSTVLLIVLGGTLMGCSYHDNHYREHHRRWDHDDRYTYRDYHDRDHYRDRDWR